MLCLIYCAKAYLALHHALHASSAVALLCSILQIAQVPRRAMRWTLQASGTEWSRVPYQSPDPNGTFHVHVRSRCPGRQGWSCIDRQPGCNCGVRCATHVLRSMHAHKAGRTRPTSVACSRGRVFGTQCCTAKAQRRRGGRAPRCQGVHSSVHLQGAAPCACRPRAAALASSLLNGPLGMWMRISVPQKMCAAAATGARD